MVGENKQLKFTWLQNKTALLLDIAALVKKIPESVDCRAFASYKRFREFLIAIGIYKVQKNKSHFVQTNNSIKS